MPYRAVAVLLVVGVVLLAVAATDVRATLADALVGAVCRVTGGGCAPTTSATDGGEPVRTVSLPDVLASGGQQCWDADVRLEPRGDTTPATLTLVEGG